MTFLVEHDPGEKERLDRMRDEEMSSEVKGMLRTLKEFNEQEHHIMCTELKQLYTAITRARVRVVIFDEDPAARAPLFYFFQSRALCDTVKILDLGDSSMPTDGFAQVTSAEEWRGRGVNLMENRVYDLAAQCFQKSGDGALENRARALTMLTRDEPELRESGNHTQLAELYVKAAEFLLQAQQKAGVVQDGLRVADCFYKAAMAAARAGQSDSAALSKSLYEMAGVAYMGCTSGVSAGMQGDARARVLRRAVTCLRRAGNIDKCVELLVRTKPRAALKLLYDEVRT